MGYLKLVKTLKYLLTINLMMVRYWFRPKSFGYGATPTTWEGWLVVAGFVIYLVGISWLIKEYSVDFFILLIAGIIGIFCISKAKTEGEWKWSWGDE